MSERLFNRLRAERERLGLTQAELARRLSVSRKTVNTIENMVITPSALPAMKIARDLDRRIEDLFWISDDG